MCPDDVSEQEQAAETPKAGLLGKKAFAKKVKTAAALLASLL